MPQIKINIFGEGIEIRHLLLDPEILEQWNEIASRKNKVITDLITDPFFYHALRNPNIRSLEDLNANVVKAMLDTSMSQIEIWFQRHKVIKFKSHELFNEMVLFPLFQIQENLVFGTNEFHAGLYAIKKEKGLLRSISIETLDEELNLDDFIFEVSYYQNNRILTNINYKNQQLQLIKSDTLIIHQSAFEIK
ncbi:hypothetical protein RCH18_001674 [Flavobacterium sp. PL11]|uniref:hypothetical protein n=1 Tax=Flavobacterium sp. PL11 TaxID=3071717 RepID=UPI002DFFAB71|nr:hypothetical protein [Flavobacterium sp. PL11]